ncbi:MAG: tetratricopeptide repeat protein [Trichlorobacter sp.]|uniref:tetratricopeptide repeat protein n=1 Tax=Trichlorobacter sp. TaxID=2911007 RepID=UPI00256654EC|nr:tetratricopeptide repeat protein [Trichlorobacter sp.]MDK9718444.1 tetratricopeptide repeat protein [Trichlorobacter sp.]
MNNAYLPGQLSHDGLSSYDQLVVEMAGMQPEQMIVRVRQFLMTYPSFGLAHNDLGVLYHRQGNPTLALAHYEKAVRLQPENLIVRKNLADFYAVELGWLEDAVEIYLDVLKRNPRDTEALCALGKIGQLMDAGGTLPEPQHQDQLPSSGPETILSQAPAMVVKPQPVTPQLSVAERYQNAVAMAAAGQKKTAIMELQGVLADYPDFAPAHNDIGVLLQEDGNNQQALLHHRKAAELQPENPVFAKNMADFLLVCMQDYEGALIIYNQLLAKTPRDKELLQALAHVCLSLDNHEDACYFIERALAVEPWNRDLRDMLQKLKEAPRMVSVAATKGDDELYQEALALVKADRLSEAQKMLEILILQAPAKALAHNDLGVVCSKLGDHAAAELHYRKAIELEPATANFRKNLADLCFVELGKTDEAINIYLDLHKKFPRDVEVLLGLGHITRAVGHEQEAKQFYRRALEIEPWNREAREALQKSSE